MTKNISQDRNSISLLIAATLLLLGCQPAYYYAMEQFGVHKRDLLVKWVQKARDSQKEAKEQFKSALEQFSSVVNVEGGQLQQKYKQLNTEFEASESKAEDVHDRITKVEDVAKALFKEWESELKQYSNDKMRKISQQKLTVTQRQYTTLIGAMKRAEKSIEPVLSTFKDQVLFLKHNLNAQAIASIQGELVSVESDVASLISDMEASIQEADTFIRNMSQEKAS
jgi:predicted  nucleic acid-binding Zn-ribbon protein